MAPLLALAVLEAYWGSWDWVNEDTKSRDGPKMSGAEVNAAFLVPGTGILVDTTSDVLSWSWRFSPTLGKLIGVGMPCCLRILFK